MCRRIIWQYACILAHIWASGTECPAGGAAGRCGDHEFPVQIPPSALLATCAPGRPTTRCAHWFRLTTWSVSITRQQENREGMGGKVAPGKASGALRFPQGALVAYVSSLRSCEPEALATVCSCEPE